MEELQKYLGRMGYDKESMKGVRYQMSVYDEFNIEYDCREKYSKQHISETQQKELEGQRSVTPIRKRGRRR